MRTSWPALVTLTVSALLAASVLLVSAQRAEHTGRQQPVVAASAFPLAIKGTFRTDGAIRGRPAVGSDGNVYLGTLNGFLYAIDRQAKLRWRRDLGAAIHGGVLIGPAGEVYVGTDDATLWSYDSQGALRFKRKVRGSIETTPAWSSAGQVLVCAGRELLAFDAHGALLFRFRTWGKLFSNPITDDEGRAYVGSQDGNFYALAVDGTERFRVFAGAAIDADAVLDGKGHVFFADEAGRVRAIDVWGEQIWSRPLGASVRGSLALAPGGEVLVTTQGPQWRLVALDPRDGAVVADRTLALSDGPEAARGGGVTVDSAGRLWLGSPVDRVWVFRGIHAPPSLVPVPAELPASPFIGELDNVVFADRAGQVWFGEVGVNATLLP